MLVPESTRVLVVDDFTSIRQVIKNVLKEFGVTQMAEASDGVEALSSLKAAHANKEPFHLVLLDIGLPKMSGMDVLRFMKNDPELKDTSVIMITAENEKKLIVEANNMGADDYIVKPFNAQSLKERLKKILGQ